MPVSAAIVTIINHENTSNALLLARGFRERAETMVIDSGSALSESEKSAFDVLLPNVYYSGLFNETLRQIKSRPDVEIILFLCSDVLIEDPPRLVDRMMSVLSDPSIGVYTPSSTGGSHAMCKAQNTGGIREIPFVDGFILAARRSVLLKIPPVDLQVNPFGWGIDVYAGYLAASMGLRTVVDDESCVHHPPGSGYDRPAAFQQLLNWLASHRDGSLFYYNAYRRFMRLSRFGLSRFAEGVIRPWERLVFRAIARLWPPKRGRKAAGNVPAPDQI